MISHKSKESKPIERKEVGEIEQSVLFQERAIDTDAIAKIKQMVGRRGMNESALFKACDTDKNGLINILDLN